MIAPGRPANSNRRQMGSRIGHILHSTGPREAQRLDLALLRTGLIVTVGLALLTAKIPPGIAVFLGPVVLRSISGISLVFALILAARLGSDSVGDVRTGLLGLIQLAGTRPWQWLLVRVAQMWIGFLSVWVVRAPALAFMFTLGGVRLRTIILTEASLLLVFFTMSSLALLLSFGASSRRQLGGRMVLVLFAWNALLVMPLAIANGITASWPQFVVPGLSEKLEWLARFSLSSQFALASSSSSTPAEVAPGMIAYGIIGFSLLAWFWRLVRTTGTMTVEERGRPQTAARRTGHRASRRCWDDALAWQAFAHYSRGARLVRIKIVGYGFLAYLAWVAVQLDYEFLAMIASPVLCGGLLMNAINKPGECLTREINEKTIGALLLTPHEYHEFVAGWRRGAWRLAAPDLVLWCLLTATSGFFHANAPPVMLCIGMVLVASEHFFILSPLMPFSFLGVTSGLGMIVVFIIVATLCGLAATLVHPWAAPAALAPLLWVLILILKRALPYWMQKKVASVL